MTYKAYIVEELIDATLTHIKTDDTITTSAYNVSNPTKKYQLDSNVKTLKFNKYKEVSTSPTPTTKTLKTKAWKQTSFLAR